MSESLAPLRASLRLNIDQFTKAIKQSQNVLKQAFGPSSQNNIGGVTSGLNRASNAANNLTGHLKSVERIIGGILISQAFYGLTLEMKSAANELAGFMGNMERAQISMRYFLGDAEKASSFIYNMKDFAATTAFNTEDALKLSQRLMAAQFDPKQVRSIMTVLNDASVIGGGTQEQLERIVLAITQIRTNGRVMGQELRQLAEANIPIYPILREELGLTADQMARIGDLKISGDLGVQAILTGLQKLYRGAAEEMSLTLPGMLETIKDNLLIMGDGLFQGPYQAVSKVVRKIRDRLEELRDYMSEGGIGAVFEQMFTEKTQNNIRMILGGLQSIGKSLIALGKAVGPGVVYVFTQLTAAMGAVIPTIAAFLRVTSGIVSAAFTAVPALSKLVAAIGALIIAQVAARALLLLWRITGMGLIASVVARAVTTLTTAIRGLMLVLTRNPIVGIIMVVAGALLYLAMSSKTVSKWLETVSAQLAALGGFDIGEIMQPDDDLDVTGWLDDFNEAFDITGTGLEGIEDGFGDIGDAAGKAGKKVKDSFLASFDEVFQVPDKDDSSGGGGKKPGGGSGGGGSPGLNMPNLGDIGKTIVPELPREIELPKLKWPEMPPIPAWVTKPWEAMKFKWPKWPDFPDFPNIPPPPGAVVTAWQMSMDAIRLKLKEFISTLEGVKVTVPNLIPQLFPQGAWNPVLETVKGWGAQLGGAFDALKQRLTEQWGQAWNSLPGIASSALQAGITTVAGMIPQWATSWDSLKTIAADVGIGILESIKANGPQWASVMSAAMLGIIGIWDEFKAAAGRAWDQVMDNLKAFWDDYGNYILIGLGVVLLAVLAWWAGIPAAIIAGLGTLIARIGGVFQRLGPTILGAINGIPKLFNTIVSLLPPEAQQVVEDIIQWFKDLPGNLEEIFEFVKRKFIEKAKEYAPEAAKTVADIIKWFKELPGKLVDALKSLPSDFAKFTKEQVNNAKTTVEDIKKWFAELPGKLVEVLKGIPADTAKMLANLPKNAKETVEDIRKWFAEAPGKLVEALKEIPGNTANMLKELPKKASETVESITTFFKELPGKLVAALLKIPGDTADMFNKLPGKAATAIGNIVKEFLSLPGKIADAISDIPSKMAGVFSKIKIPSFTTMSDGVKATFRSLGSIAGFKNGGIIDKDSIVRVGEQGKREAIIPLQNASAMQPFVDAVVQGVLAMSPATGGGGGDDRRPVYVGNLIADRRGLKELERELRIIRLQEDSR